MSGRRGNSLIRPAMKQLLQEMARPVVDDDWGYGDDNEVICEGGICYIGTRRIARKTVDDLLRLCLISDIGYGGGAEHYEINDNGRSVLRRPQLAEEMRIALLAGTPFTVRDDKIEHM